MKHINYKCTSNDNIIAMRSLESNDALDELYFGHESHIDGLTVIGFEDLSKALSTFGYTITKEH